jgi:hypothetical protein
MKKSTPKIYKNVQKYHAFFSQIPALAPPQSCAITLLWKVIQYGVLKEVPWIHCQTFCTMTRGLCGALGYDYALHGHLSFTSTTQTKTKQKGG